MSEKYFIGIDVGTGSARAALVSATGKIIRTHLKEIQTWTPQPDHYEQSSNNIWNAVCECVRVCIKLNVYSDLDLCINVSLKEKCN